MLLFADFGVNTGVNSGDLFRQFDLPLHVHQHNALDDTRSLVASLIALYQRAPEKTFQHLNYYLINDSH